MGSPTNRTVSVASVGRPSAGEGPPMLGRAREAGAPSAATTPGTASATEKSTARRRAGASAIVAHGGAGSNRGLLRSSDRRRDVQAESMAPTIRALRVRPVDVPLARPIITSSGVIPSAPLVLVDLLTDEDVTGCAYLFCYTSLALAPVARLVADLEPLVRGEAAAPLALDRKLQATFRLLGPQGLTGMAMAAIDMAAWDAMAKAHGLPLVRLLGAEPRPIRAYHSLGRDG